MQFFLKQEYTLHSGQKANRIRHMFKQHFQSALFFHSSKTSNYCDVGPLKRNWIESTWKTSCIKRNIKRWNWTKVEWSTTNINGHQIEMATVEIGIKEYDSFYLRVLCASKWNEIRSYVAHIKLIHRECRHRKILPFFHIWSLLNDEKLCLAFHLKSHRDASSLYPLARPFDSAFPSALLLFVIVHSLPETKFYSMMMVCPLIFIAIAMYYEKKSNKTREREKKKCSCIYKRWKSKKYLSRTAEATQRWEKTNDVKHLIWKL